MHLEQGLTALNLTANHFERLGQDLIVLKREVPAKKTFDPEIYEITKTIIGDRKRMNTISPGNDTGDVPNITSRLNYIWSR